MYDLGTTTRTLCVTPFFVEADSWQTPHIIKSKRSRRFHNGTSNENDHYTTSTTYSMHISLFGDSGTPSLRARARCGLACGQAKTNEHDRSIRP